MRICFYAWRLLGTYRGLLLLQLHWRQKKFPADSLPTCIKPSKTWNRPAATVSPSLTITVSMHSLPLYLSSGDTTVNRASRAGFVRT